MSYDIRGISREVSYLDGLSDPILTIDKLVVSDELMALKEAYFMGLIDAKAVREFFTKHVTIGSERTVVGDTSRASTSLNLVPTEVVNGRTVDASRPLFQINPARVSTGAQPFQFYFQNWEDVDEPVKFYWKRSKDEMDDFSARNLRRVMLPVPPEKVEWSNSNSLEEVQTAVGNTFLHSGPQSMETIRLEGFFPHVTISAEALSGARPGSTSSVPDYIPQAVLAHGLFQAKTLRNMFMEAMQAAQPLRFTVCLPGMENSGHVICTRPVVISDFEWRYNHGHGLDVFYTMTLRGWRPQKVFGFDKPVTVPPPVVPPVGGPTPPKPNQQCKKGWHLQYIDGAEPVKKSDLSGGVGRVEESVDASGKPLPSGWFCVPPPPVNTGTVGNNRPGGRPIPDTHKIKSGDTLWGIADKYYGKGEKWEAIHKLNIVDLNKALKAHGQKTPNPNLIYPGTVLKLPKS